MTIDTIHERVASASAAFRAGAISAAEYEGIRAHAVRAIADIVDNASRDEEAARIDRAILDGTPLGRI